jgi:hypothetical protein
MTKPQELELVVSAIELIEGQPQSLRVKFSHPSCQHDAIFTLGEVKKYGFFPGIKYRGIVGPKIGHEPENILYYLQDRAKNIIYKNPKVQH